MLIQYLYKWFLIYTFISILFKSVIVKASNFYSIRKDNNHVLSKKIIALVYIAFVKTKSDERLIYA